MRQYRKKAIVVQAVQVDEDPKKTLHELIDMGAPFVSISHHPPGILIDTLEGTMRADIGDWVIRGVKGEFYPCKPEIFAETYEEVAE